MLLEQKVERQTCQRAALRELFEVENPYSEFMRKKNHYMLQQGSIHRRRWLCRATRSARLLRSASAAFASAASIVATNASVADDSLVRILLQEIPYDYLKDQQNRNRPKV